LERWKRQTGRRNSQETQRPLSFAAEHCHKDVTTFFKQESFAWIVFSSEFEDQGFE
jgi:hypothetical protein